MYSLSWIVILQYVFSVLDCTVFYCIFCLGLYSTECIFCLTLLYVFLSWIVILQNRMYFLFCIVRYSKVFSVLDFIPQYVLYFHSWIVFYSLYFLSWIVLYIKFSVMGSSMYFLSWIVWYSILQFVFSVLDWTLQLVFSVLDCRYSTVCIFCLGLHSTVM
jgi:hypothetical protein